MSRSLCRPHHVPVPLPHPALLHTACAQPVGAGGAAGRGGLVAGVCRGFERLVWPQCLQGTPQCSTVQQLRSCLPLPTLPINSSCSLQSPQGIALASDPNYKVLGAAYPWIARRLLTDTTPELRRCGGNIGVECSVTAGDGGMVVHSQCVATCSCLAACTWSAALPCGLGSPPALSASVMPAPPTAAALQPLFSVPCAAP